MYKIISLKNIITFYFFLMYAQCALRYTYHLPVLHKLCKLVPISRPFRQWGVWVDAITWYCHILTAEPHFNSETENTHTEYLNTSSTAIYLQKMANELRSIKTYVYYLTTILQLLIKNLLVVPEIAIHTFVISPIWHVLFVCFLLSFPPPFF